MDKYKDNGIGKLKQTIRKEPKVEQKIDSATKRPVVKKKKKKIYKYKAKKDSGFTDKQVSMQKDIKEKSHGQYPKKYKEDKHGRFKGKVFHASPKILSEAGMTGSGKSTGMPGHSISTTYTKDKGTVTDYVRPYGGAIETGFKGYDKRTPGKGLKLGGSVRLARKGGGRAYGQNS
jgi:hypothetical protein|tara:strand:- start:43 stop:567 length:525 start_codon:yes stop_codon:yes gene_type:complete